MSDRRETTLESPHVQHILKTLEERILSGLYPPGRWLPPERTLCVEFGVSRPTLRLALIELEKRHLLLRAAGCRPLVRNINQAVVTKRETMRGNIGLCIKHDPKFSGTYLITQGVQQALNSDAYRLIVTETQAVTLQEVGAGEAQALTRMIRDEDIAGIILWYSGLESNLSALQAVRAARIPMVFIDRRPPNSFEADFVGIDNVRAAREAVHYLLTRGHRSIAHITNPEPVSAVSDRLEGYRQALQAAGIPFRPELVLTGRIEGMAEEGLNANEIADRLLNLPDPPTALFAVTDYIALVVVRALREHGLRIPEDMAILGFDDLEQWSPHEPFLTTIRQPFERMGAEAVSLLLKRIQAERQQTYRHLLLDTLLVTRASA